MKLLCHLTSLTHQAKIISYTTQMNSVEYGFPNRCFQTKPEIHDFWEVWHCLSSDRGLELMNRKNVVPNSLRQKVLCSLHSVHQEVVDMMAHVND